MIILRGNNLNVDFKYPVELTEEQRYRFFNFLRTLFSYVDDTEVESPRIKRMGDSLFIKHWDAEELALVCDLTKVNEELCRMLGRTWMNVNIHRGKFIPQLLARAKEKGIDIYQVDLKKFIEDFMKENEEIKAFKRKRRHEDKNELSNLYKRRDGLVKEISGHRSFGIQQGLTTEEATKKKEKELQEVENRIKEIEGSPAYISDRK